MGCHCPPNAITCEASFVGGDVEQSKCYDVVTFRYQVCDAKAEQGDVLSLKMDLIKNVFRPDREFVFPLMGKRKCVRNWLDIYEWLCYSPLKEGGFCLLCVLFTDDLFSKKSQSQRLFTIPFQPTSDSKRRF